MFANIGGLISNVISSEEKLTFIFEPIFFSPKTGQKITKTDLVALLEPPFEASKMSLALSSILRPQESRMLSRILRLQSFSKEQGPLFKRSVSVSFHWPCSMIGAETWEIFGLILFDPAQLLTCAYTDHWFETNTLLSRKFSKKACCLITESILKARVRFHSSDYSTLISSTPGL